MSFNFILIARGNRTYRYDECIILCNQRATINFCQCYDVYFYPLNGPKYSETKPCLTSQQITCTDNSYINFLKQDLNQLCSHDCPISCNTTGYDFDLTYSQFPAEAYAKQYLFDNPVILKHFENTTPSYETLKKNVVAVQINSPELKIGYLTESPKETVIDVIANIGGLLALCFGASIMSIGELFQLCFSLLFFKHDIQAATESK